MDTAVTIYSLANMCGKSEHHSYAKKSKSRYTLEDQERKNKFLSMSSTLSLLKIESKVILKERRIQSGLFFGRRADQNFFSRDFVVMMFPV